MFDQRLAVRLKQLRQEIGCSLDQLAEKCGISRATLSRMEKAEVSPTAEALGKLCSVYGMPMSRLMAMVEEGFEPLIRKEQQAIWRDQQKDFTRRSVSPPATGLKGEVIAGTLGAGQHIEYHQPSLAGLEHHLVMQSGELRFHIDEKAFDLKAGDCLRYVLADYSAFTTPQHSGASYLIFLI
jgi:transcriptional regulator with XRE-family HTH domain